MIDCMKKYQLTLTDNDGNVYKSGNVDISESRVYDIEKDGRLMTVDMHLVAWGFQQTNKAGTPPEMPTAEVAAAASKIIQEEKRKAAIEKEWTRLTDEICKAVKAGDEKIYSKVVFGENKERLEEMGYYLVMSNAGTFEYRIAWAGIYMDLHRD